MTIFRARSLGLSLLTLFLSHSTGYGINCKQMSQFVDAYIKMHYSADSFGNELGKRTLDNYLKALDPGKMYFLSSDVAKIHEVYGQRLDDMIRRSDCKALNSILRVYARRFDERQSVINDWIEFEHDFTVEEYFDTDRKKREYCATVEELNERWHLQVKYQLLRLTKRYDGPDKARSKLHKRFELSRKHLSELDAVEIASIFLNAFSTSLDPHTSYMSPDLLEEFRISTALSLNGIGAVLRSEYGVTTVQSLIQGGPAEKGGILQVGDRMVAVAQGEEDPVDLMDMKLRDVVNMVRGERGTEVGLTVEREEKEATVNLEIPIVRDKIELTDREAKAYSFSVDVYEDSDQPKLYKIGLIQLPSFYIDFEGRKEKEKDFKSSSADVRELINDLKEEGIDALVIDLRNNSGGSLDEAVNIAGLFFDYGPVVQVRNTDGSKQILADADVDTHYDGPLVLLTNRHSASSSEILAGAIQDYERGLIIGDSHTFGKGTVQKVNEVREGELGAMKVTISQFFRPSGSSTQLRGVEADIVIPDMVDEYEVGEKFYDYVLPWNSIERAKFPSLSLVDAYRDTLLAASEERIQMDTDFQELARDIDSYRENEEERTRVSLKEEEDPELKDEDEESADNSDQSENAESTEATESQLAAGEKEEEGEETESDEEDEKPSLVEDILLRETLAITADYLQLLNDRTLVAIRYPNLHDYNLDSAVSEEESDQLKETADAVEGY